MICQLKNVIVRRKQESGYSLEIRNFHLHEGEHVAVIGPSGCGKSTLLDLLGMILQPDQCDEFRFFFDGVENDVHALWDKKRLDAMADIRRKNIGYILQTGELLPYLNVKENIELTARLAGRKNRGESARRMMSKLEIERHAKSMPSTLSIGERQRVAIARALVARPRLVLADEPTAALDPTLSRKVIQLFLEGMDEMDGKNSAPDVKKEFEPTEEEIRTAPERTEEAIKPLPIEETTLETSSDKAEDVSPVQNTEAVLEPTEEEIRTASERTEEAIKPLPIEETTLEMSSDKAENVSPIQNTEIVLEQNEEAIRIASNAEINLEKCVKNTNSALVLVSHDHALVREFNLRIIEIRVEEDENGNTRAILDDGGEL